MIIARNTKESEVKRNIREATINKFYEMVCSMPEFRGKVSRIKNGISIAVDDVEMPTGELGEVCVEIKPTVPGYIDKINTYGEVKYAYERLKEEDAYYEAQLEKEEKAERIKREKEERARKLQEARAERLRQKLAALENSVQ